jgi:hypothetical protein
MLEDLTAEEIHQTVDRAVQELLDQTHITTPPVNAIQIAQSHLGMTVCVDGKQPQRGRAQRVAGKRQIFLRPEPNEERHQWTVAHEIGEHCKPDLLIQLGLEPGQTRPMTGESLANLFANRLLVPTPWLEIEARASAHDLALLKTKFSSASHEVIAWRLLDLAEPCVITIFDNGQVHRRRSNAWRVTRELTPAEQECQRYVHHYSRPRVVRTDGWTVQGWPVHQSDWKREVLRSVLDESG